MEETKVLQLRGMTCTGCEMRIQRKLEKTEGIISCQVSFSESKATVTYNPEKISLNGIKALIRNLDYEVVESKVNNGKKNDKITNILGAVLLIYAIYTIMRYFGFTDVFNFFPEADENMSYGVLFVIGVLTSFHCVAMCGGINLSQCLHVKDGKPEKGRFAGLRPGLLYNAGRVISYTVIGGIVGAAGSVIQLPGSTKGIVQVIAGIFMVVMGINMLDIFPWLRRFNPRMPKIFAAKIHEGKQSNSPLYVGLLNGLMPCGPLQAMQLYALSTADPVKGALSMFLFSLGTVPLMFLLGAVSTFLSKKFAHKMMTTGAVLVVILGISMFSSGMSLFGFPVLTASAGNGNATENAKAEVTEDKQVVTTSLSSGRYEPITVQAGIPVEWTIQAAEGTINGCNNRIIIPEYGIEKKLEVGDNVITFTPSESGTFSYSCWMGMIRSTITVTGSGSEAAQNNSGSESTDNDSAYEKYDSDSLGGELSDYRIPTEEVVIAEIKEDGTQYVKTDMKQDTFTPALIIVQAETMTKWTIQVDNEAVFNNDAIGFPLYAQQIPITKGENLIQLYPTEDFGFSANNNAFFGYVKVVDDINNIDLDAIKKEVGEYVPENWDYSQTSFGSGASCH